MYPSLQRQALFTTDANVWHAPTAGMGERAIELMGKRALQRIAFKKAVAQHGAFQ